MKKLFFLGALFAVGLGFTACSSDKDSVADINQDGPIGTNGYIAIAINMPVQESTMTRASDAGNDQNNNVEFNDGLAGEYAVKNVTLLIFDGSENFVEAHDITPAFDSNSDPNVTWTMVSQSEKLVQTVSNKITAGFKMLVVLNRNGIFAMNGSDNIKFTGESSNFAGSFSEFQQKVATTTGLNDAPSMTGTGNSDYGFYMSNAPLADVAGSGTSEPSAAKVQVLVPISAVYKTQSEASASNADQIYVERGVAKVTMEPTLISAGHKFSVAKVNGSADLYYETTSWTLDNTNKNAYLVRESSSFDTYKSLHSLVSGGLYRTIGETGITHTPLTYKYRVYFSEGKDFSTTTTDDVPSYLNKVTDNSTFQSGFYTSITVQNPQYCFENTFPVDKQSLKYTTLVQLALTAKTSTTADAVDLFTKGSDKSTIYVTSSIQTDLGNTVIEIINASDESKSTYLNSSVLASAEDFEIESLTPDAGTLTGAVLKLKTSAASKYKASAIYKDGTGTSAVIADALQPTAAWFTSNPIMRYAGGVSYYNIRIKHFGNNLTPWNSSEYSGTAPSGNTTTYIYPGATTAVRNNNYLGRYGVLRNNWYHLSVSSVRFLGDATPNTTKWDETPDDEADQYISTQINILSWAKRTQNADL